MAKSANECRKERQTLALGASEPVMSIRYDSILRNAQGKTQLIQSKNGNTFFAIISDGKKSYEIKLPAIGSTNWKAISAATLNDTTGSVVWVNDQNELIEFKYTIDDNQKSWTTTNEAPITLLSAQANNAIPIEVCLVIPLSFKKFLAIP